MATHSSVLVWRIPEMGEPDGLPSMGSHRVGHDWRDLQQQQQQQCYISQPQRSSGFHCFYWPLNLPSGEGNGTPLQCSCLENPMEGGSWKPAVHGVAEGLTRLSDFTFTFHFHELEKEMATHSSVLAWRIPGMGEPGGLPSVGSHRVGHDWSDLAAAAARER